MKRFVRAKRAGCGDSAGSAGLFFHPPEEKEMSMANRTRLCSIAVLSATLSAVLHAVSFSSWPEIPLSSQFSPGSAYGTQSSPAVAWGGINLLAVWDDERISTDKDIFGGRFTAQGEALDPAGFPICTASSWQIYPEVAAGDQVYLVVWEDYRSGTYEIYGARVDFDGNVLDSDGFPICTGDWLMELPAVAWDGTNFLVAWSDDRDMISRDIYAARVTSSGAVLEPNGFRVSSGSLLETNPSIAYNGTNYLVVWEVEGG